MRQWNGRTPARRGNWLIGCGVVLAVIVVILLGVGIYVAVNLRGWAASGMQAGMNSVVDSLPIDDGEKVESHAVVDGFIQDFRDGKVTYAQLGKIFEELTKGPVMPAAAALGVGHMYFRDSDLDATTKADGMVQIARVAHGLASKAITPDDLPDILEPLKAKATERDTVQFDLPDGTHLRLKAPPSATAEDLKAFVQAARTVCDEKGLPAAPPSFDLSTELQHAIDVGTGKALPEPTDAPDPGITPDDAPTAEPTAPDETAPDSDGP